MGKLPFAVLDASEPEDIAEMERQLKEMYDESQKYNNSHEYKISSKELKDSEEKRVV